MSLQIEESSNEKGGGNTGRWLRFFLRSLRDCALDLIFLLLCAVTGSLLMLLTLVTHLLTYAKVAVS